MNHTPTPWHADELGVYTTRQPGARSSSGKTRVALCRSNAQSTFSDNRIAESEANAAHIVRCVNAYDILVRALIKARTEVVMGAECDAIDEALRKAGYEGELSGESK